MEIKIEVPKDDFKDLDNLVNCECGNWTHHSYSRMDGDGSNACPNCTLEFSHQLIDKLTELLKEVSGLSDEQLTKLIKLKYADIMTVTVEELEDMHYFDDIELL